MGLFSGAGVDRNKVPDDPFQFGKNYWELMVSEVPPAKPSLKDNQPTGRFGSYMKFKLTHERYDRVMPFGQWIQLPPPLELQEITGIKFDAENNPDDIVVVQNLTDFLLALGFELEEMDEIKDIAEIQTRGFMAKMKKPKQNDTGFWELGWYMPKRFGSVEGLDVFAPGGNSQPAGNSAADLNAQMAAEIAAMEAAKAAE